MALILLLVAPPLSSPTSTRIPTQGTTGRRSPVSVMFKTRAKDLLRAIPNMIRTPHHRHITTSATPTARTIDAKGVVTARRAMVVRDERGTGIRDGASMVLKDLAPWASWVLLERSNNRLSTTLPSMANLRPLRSASHMAGKRFIPSRHQTTLRPFRSERYNAQRDDLIFPFFHSLIICDYGVSVPQHLQVELLLSAYHSKAAANTNMHAVERLDSKSSGRSKRLIRIQRYTEF